MLYIYIMADDNFDYLMPTARQYVAGEQGLILNADLRTAALDLYSRAGGSFSSDEAAINFMIYSKPSEVAKLIFKEAESIGNNIRHYIENLTPGRVDESPGSSQCGKGSQYNPVDLTFQAGKTFCWLCGCPISRKNPKNGPECEHIIPALRAAMTVGMFSRAIILDKIRTSMGATLGGEQWWQWNAATANNYLWAHSVCNQSSGKGSMVLLGYNEGAGQFDFNSQNGAILQEKIYKIIKSGVIQPIPAQCQGQNSCYRRKDGGERFYGNCTTADGNQWDPDQDGCVRVNQPFDAYQWEMKRAATQVNQVWEQFGGNIRAFAEYCLMQTKLYLNAEGLELAMTEKERLEAVLQQQREEAEKLAEYKEECAKVTVLIAEQIGIIKELHKLSAQTLMITASDAEAPLSEYIFTNDLIKAKSRFRDQIQKIFTVYCRGSSNVLEDGTSFVEHIMLKFFTDKTILSGNIGEDIGPGGGWRDDIAGMMNLLVQFHNAEEILTEYISCLVLFNIYEHYGWRMVAKMPHPTASTDELAAILYPYPGNQSASEIQKVNRLRHAFVQQHTAQTESPSGRSRRGEGEFQRRMNNIFQAAGTNFVLPAFDSEHACKLYLMQLFTILVGAVITNIPEDEWAPAFDLVITQQGQLLTQIAADGDTIVQATQADVGERLSQTSEEQLTNLAEKTVAGVLEKMITTNLILTTFLTQAPKFEELLKNEDLYKSMVPVIGCNLMQRILSVVTPGHPITNFLTGGRDLFCGQLGIDTAAIEATASMPSRSAAEARAASSDADLIAAQSDTHIIDNPAWVQHGFGGGRRKKTRKRKRRKYRTIKKKRRRRKVKSLKRRRRMRRRRKKTRGK